MAIQQRSLLALLREAIASRDAVTGTLSPAAFERAVEAWIGGGASTRRPSSSLLLVRIDWTTRAGRTGAPGKRQVEQVLKTVAMVTGGCLRTTDVLGRVDDATLGILLPSTPAQQAAFVSRRVRAGVAERTRLTGFPVTVSIGLATALQLDTWGAATEALEEAQLSGGDRTIVAQLDQAAA